VLTADHSGRSCTEDTADRRDAAVGGEELDRREAEVLEKALKDALGQEEKEPDNPPPVEPDRAPDDRHSERDAVLAAALEALQNETAWDYREDLSPERENRTAMTSDEINVIRHDSGISEPKFELKPEKFLE